MSPDRLLRFNACDCSLFSYYLFHLVHQWRSPEEYFDEPLTEQIDVFSLGNNMYSLLTGLWPFYDEEDDSEMKVRDIGQEEAKY
jgi:serine/threonine protein kinase